VPLSILLRSAGVLSALIVCAVASAGHASNGPEAGTRPWRADLLAPVVRDATRSPGFWNVAAAVAEWRDLDANINPVMSSVSRPDIVVLERSSPRWLAKAQVFVRDGYIIRGRVLLNPTIRRAPHAKLAQHLLCRELGAVLGLTGGTCASGNVLTTSPTLLDEARLAKLYSSVASSVSTEPYDAGRGRWITIDVVPVR
jgi:hypothetical protein